MLHQTVKPGVTPVKKFVNETLCGRSLEYYNSESVKPDICSYTAQRPPMAFSPKTRFPMSCVHETLPRRTEPGPDWKNVNKLGVTPPFLRDGPLKISFSNFNISKTGKVNFAKFLRDCGFPKALSTISSRGRWGFKLRG